MDYLPSLTKDQQARAEDIKLLIMDVDGVMTDGGLIQGDDGLEYKQFHARDGLGLKLLRSTGVALAIVTGRSSTVVQNRAKELGVIALHQGCHQKDVAFKEICADASLQHHEAAFMGDDIIDLPALALAGFALGVADAHALVLQQSQWVSSAPGGKGAVREACEMLMHAKGTLSKAMEPYLPC